MIEVSLIDQLADWQIKSIPISNRNAKISLATGNDEVEFICPEVGLSDERQSELFFGVIEACCKEVLKKPNRTIKLKTTSYYAVLQLMIAVAGFKIKHDQVRFLVWSGTETFEECLLDENARPRSELISKYFKNKYVLQAELLKLRRTEVK